MINTLGFSGAPFVGASLIGAATAGVFAFNVPLIATKAHMLGRQINSGWLFEKKQISQAPQQIPQKPNPMESNIVRDIHEEPVKKFTDDVVNQKRGAQFILAGGTTNDLFQIER